MRLILFLAFFHIFALTTISCDKVCKANICKLKEPQIKDKKSPKIQAKNDLDTANFKTKNVKAKDVKSDDYEKVYKEKFKKYAEKEDSKRRPFEFKADDPLNQTVKTCKKQKYQLNCKKSYPSTGDNNRQGTKNNGGKNLYIKRENNLLKQVDSNETPKKKENNKKPVENKKKVHGKSTNDRTHKEDDSDESSSEEDSDYIPKHKKK